MSNTQNQHYVPKFILRQFLTDEIKEQVTVFDKKTERVFATQIKNIMAERRFNDFYFEDFSVSFEGIACGIEDQVLPAYQKVLLDRELERTPEQQASLAFLMAFQFMRTKAMREMSKSMRDGLETWLVAHGISLDRVKGWEPYDENKQKMFDLGMIKNDLGRFAEIIAQKDFFLFEPSPQRSFYLGDNPVSLYNTANKGPRGTLGLASQGVEIYMPLSSDLLLGALCPSLGDIVFRERVQVERGKMKKLLFAAYLRREIEMNEIHSELQLFDQGLDVQNDFIEAAKTGKPVKTNADNMDFFNSLQVKFASRYVVCKKKDFELAKSWNREFPDSKPRMRFG